MKPTKRTHYNPCFWTAHWNPDYFVCSPRRSKPAAAAVVRLIWAATSGTEYPWR